MLAPTIICSTDNSSSFEILSSPSKSYIRKATETPKIHYQKLESLQVHKYKLNVM